MVLSPRIELEIDPYHGSVIPFNYEGKLLAYLKRCIKCYFSNNCLNFLAFYNILNKLKNSS